MSNSCELNIPPILPNQPCDICKTKDSVESEQLEITTCGETEMIRLGHYRQSNLCRICKENGWVLLNDTADFGQLHYFNNNQSASIRFKRV